MPYRIPDWLSQIANDNPNLVEDSPTFRAVEETQQKKNLVKATNQALQQHAEEVKQQQIKAITGQLQAIKQLKDHTDIIHKNLPDFGTQMKAKSNQVMSGPATNTPHQDPQDFPDQYPTGDNPPPPPGASTMPYVPSRPSNGPGDIPSNQFTPGDHNFGSPSISAPPQEGGTSEGTYQPNDQQRIAGQDPSQNMSVQDVMAISQSTGLPPQQVASMILMGDNIMKNQPPQPMPAPPSASPPSPVPFAA